MIPVLTIVEDFLPRPRFFGIRAAVLARGFETENIKEAEGHPEVPYENVQIKYMPPDFQELLPYAVGRQIGMHQQAFRFGHEGSQLHNLVHADHCCSSLAAVFYMNLPEDCQGGTAFWRHKKHGWCYMPDSSKLEAAGYTIEQLAEDWHDKDAWTMHTLAGAAPNRLIIYPTAAFHSRWPWEGFGQKEDPEHARLIWCGFFDVL